MDHKYQLVEAGQMEKKIRAFVIGQEHNWQNYGSKLNAGDFVDCKWDQNESWYKASVRNVYSKEDLEIGRRRRDELLLAVKPVEDFGIPVRLCSSLFFVVQIFTRCSQKAKRQRMQIVDAPQMPADKSPSKNFLFQQELAARSQQTFTIDYSR